MSLTNGRFRIVCAFFGSKACQESQAAKRTYDSESYVRTNDTESYVRTNDTESYVRTDDSESSVRRIRTSHYLAFWCHFWWQQQQQQSLPLILHLYHPYQANPSHPRSSSHHRYSLKASTLQEDSLLKPQELPSLPLWVFTSGGVAIRRIPDPPFPSDSVSSASASDSGSSESASDSGSSVPKRFSILCSQ